MGMATSYMQLRADRLREVRQHRLLTQAELAAEAGLTTSTLSRLESGLQAPRPSTIRKLAAVLRISTDELVAWNEEHI